MSAEYSFNNKVKPKLIKPKNYLTPEIKAQRKKNYENDIVEYFFNLKRISLNLSKLEFNCLRI